MRMRRHTLEIEEGDDEHGIDLAPMLDFVMNLLIFFIITAVFVKELGLMVNRPSGQIDNTPSGAASIPVHILQNGEIWIEGRVIDLRAVRANVELLLRSQYKPEELEVILLKVGQDDKSPQQQPYVTLFRIAPISVCEKALRVSVR